ncbi:MAG TPA: AAA family ATPase, partial [Methanocorpusculum sp.]|nr:AAA family ATPase [Methanocorpusculum sp.]
QAGYFFRAESFFNVATASEKYGTKYGGKRLHSQSHGESFLAFFQEFSNRRGIYIMDEPEAALSPQRQLTLLLIIAEMAKNGSQFIIATHSPILLGLPEASIFSFSNGAVSPVSYEETESYQITKMFFENRDRLFEELFED